MPERFPVFLNLTSFTSIGAIGAEHWYARLRAYDYRDPRREVREVTYRMTAAQARRLSEKDQRRRAYRAGDETERFDTLEQAMTAAKRVFLERYLPLGGVLVDDSDRIGDDVSHNCPKLLLWPPDVEKVAGQINTIHAAFEDAGRWESRARRKVLRMAQDAERLWKSIFEQHEHFREA